VTTIPFEHSLAAHCETGTMAAMLRHNGLRLSEPMILGIAGGIFFAYLKPAALKHATIITRSRPGDIRPQIAKRLGVKFWSRAYRDPVRARTDLNGFLDRGTPVAVQTDMFYFDYWPDYQRNHFNAHFVVIVGRENGEYLVSDSYRAAIERVPEAVMDKARFARGELAPKGLAFCPIKVPASPDLKKAIVAGIKSACFNMVKLPMPFLGVKGMRLLAKKLPQWPAMVTDIEMLSHEAMMINVSLEERGTGGAGFRFMYASFLQEAAKLLNRPEFDGMAKDLMAIGDSWREFSLQAARMGKRRELGVDSFKTLSGMVSAQADREEVFFKKLLKLV
jgi:hypothetical protein